MQFSIRGEEDKIFYARALKMQLISQSEGIHLFFHFSIDLNENKKRSHCEWKADPHNRAEVPESVRRGWVVKYKDELAAKERKSEPRSSHNGGQSCSQRRELQ